MILYRKSPVAARELGIAYHRLIGLIRYGIVGAPIKDTSGDYLWSEADLTAARRALAQRPDRAGQSARDRVLVSQI